ncbi:MAG TPA: glycoside hydrolase family 15 protein, partial [Steroidobacteraceae bacterium]|nr:glycoside hydrolase family 15 protein [Steroidobacteraceae bacterium]
LLDALGRMVWACVPRPDSDPIFCSLLDSHGAEAKNGVFAIELLNSVGHQQDYLRNSAVVETVLNDAAGNQVRLTDFCPRFRERGRVFKPMMYIRIVEPLHGQPRIRMRFKPVNQYGLRPSEMTLGSHHLRVDAADVVCRLTTDASLTALVEEQPVILHGPLAFILGPDETLEAAPLSLARHFLEQTVDYWQEWVRTLAIPIDWQAAVIRAAITLKLCTYEDSGAVLAALTTSIPESAQSGRNWDYRYCWLRDSFFVIQALNRLGATRTMEGFLRYLNNVIAQSPTGALRPAYSVAGDSTGAELLRQNLDGYRGMGPVRVGNLALMQRQHDVYGAVIMATSQFFYDARLIAPGDAAFFSRLEALGTQAEAVFAQPDAGPWEFRGVEKVHTYSACMCWAACDRLARIASHLGLSDRNEYWHSRAAAMKDRLLEQSWSETNNSLVDSIGGQDLDATALLLPELGLMSATDPRFVATMERIERELRQGDYIFRYRHADDFGVPRNAFTVCSFWYVNALARMGRTSEAREAFERLLTRRNHLGMFSEDIDPATHEHWGNYPQTYSMVGIISSALRLSRPWEEVV